MINTRTIKLCTLTSAVVLSLFLAGSAQAQRAEWVIESFDSLIEVQEDASLIVTETIEADFSVYKHGIYRTIPTTYEGSGGERVTIDIDLLSVLQDGQPAMIDESSWGGDWSVRIGDPNRTITGAHTYEITYEVERAMLYFDDYDEVYWNVTGFDWDASILSTTAVVVLPDGAQATQWACYVGSYGSTSQDCGAFQEGSEVAFAADDFLTIAVGFPKGVVDEPTVLTRLTWFFFANWPIALPWIFFLFVLRIWWKNGRDARSKKTIIAQYEPPEGILAVYAGRMVDGRLKKHHQTAMIIQLAVMGHVKIKVDSVGKNGKKLRKPKVTLLKLSGGTELDAAHQQMMDVLFGKKTEKALSDLKGTISAGKITFMKNAIMQELIDRGWFTKHSFKRQAMWMILGGMAFFFSPMFGAIFGSVAAVSTMIATAGVIVLGWYMPQTTPAGSEVLWKTRGFKEFMHTAERYRSEWQEKEHIFADYLPYAIAFNDVDRWAKTFKGVHQAKPDWYDSTDAFTMALMISQLDNVTSSIAAATTPKAPSGSGGSGGGGFSGGGFGGGGGGSW